MRLQLFRRCSLTLAVVLAVAATACSSGESSRPPASATQVDVQVLNDVVDWILPLPGAASQARARRISNFTNGIQYKACGATPPQLDYVDDTAGNQYPDLDLIRDRGLPPIYDAVKYYHLKKPYGSDQSIQCSQVQELCRAAGDAMRKGAANAQALMAKCRQGMKTADPFMTSAAYQHAATVAATWQNDTMLSAQNSTPVLDAAKPAAECLRKGSGLHVTDDDPSNSFLRSVNVAYFGDHAASVETMWTWSRLYAQCAAPYFAAVKQQLQKQRPALIERYREQMQDFARALVAAGYVP